MVVTSWTGRKHKFTPHGSLAKGVHSKTESARAVFLVGNTLSLYD